MVQKKTYRIYTIQRKLEMLLTYSIRIVIVVEHLLSRLWISLI